MGCLSMFNCLRLIEALLCAITLVTATFGSQIFYPYSGWCEFTWVFCFLVAVVILVLELLKLNLLLAMFLQHSWGDLTAGLTMLCTLMLLSASIIYPMRMLMCQSCFFAILCALLSFVAMLVFLSDGVMDRMGSGCQGGEYLSAPRGVLHLAEAFFSCLICTACASYFFGVSATTPLALVWCLFVYVVCLVVTVVIILFNLLKILNGLLCVVKMELFFNVAAVLCYISAMILWPIYGNQYYYGPLTWDHDQRTIPYYGFRHYDLLAVTALTAVNLVLYVVDLIVSLLRFYKRI